MMSVKELPYLKVFPDLSVMKERLVTLFKREVGKGHDLLRQVRLESAVHARMDRQPIFVGSDGIVVHL